METSNQIKEEVKRKYSGIADRERPGNASGCCGSMCCSADDASVMAEDYTKLTGYEANADLGLGCGLPTQFAFIKEGDTVIDLGSGAGNDCFVARSLAGAAGKVIGVDFTERMIQRARENAERLKYNNVEFRLGDIEQLPVADNTADVVVSNCVLNLVPDKDKAVREMHRVLKPGGHFSVSDIVLTGDLPSKLRAHAELYVGCIAGAMEKDSYLKLLKDTGFTNIRVQKEKGIEMPEAILAEHLPAHELEAFRKTRTEIQSVTVYGEKSGPADEKNAHKTPAEACCDPGCCAN